MGGGRRERKGQGLCASRKDSFCEEEKCETEKGESRRGGVRKKTGRRRRHGVLERSSTSTWKSRHLLRRRDEGARICVESSKEHRQALRVASRYAVETEPGPKHAVELDLTRHPFTAASLRHRHA
eukprot:643860-Hanusia_phi.AAC.3